MLSRLVLPALFLCFVAGQSAVQGRVSRNQDDESRTSNSSEAIDKGLRYLLDAQGADGKWHSPSYGNLKDGAAITCLVLYAVSTCRDQISDDDKSNLQRVVDELSRIIQAKGFVANENGPDYSNYASAMLLIADKRLGLDLPRVGRSKLIDYLVRAQLDEAEGFAPANRDYGGWDLTGWMTGHRPTTGTNISVTATVLQALAPYQEVAGVEEAFGRARIWIARCQNQQTDGGFFFHPQLEHDGNKAGWIDDARTRPRSYGTATADGLRCLSNLGVAADSNEITIAVKWLEDRPELERVPGFDHESGEASWAIGLRFYYYFTLAESLQHISPSHARTISADMTRNLIRDQRTNGSWQNSNARMREDDPIIATCFAIIALTKCQQWIER